MRTISRAAFAVSLLLFSSSPFAECGAQDIAEITAYFALNSTPSAAFAPVVTRTMLGEARSGADFIFRYGRADLVLVEADNLALTWVNGGARGSFGFTAGYWKPDCDDCDGHFVAGLGGDLRLLNSPVGATPGTMFLTAALSTELGFGWPEDATIWTAVLALPVTLVAGSTISGVRIAPFLSPGFGWGRISDDNESESGTRPMLGGGLAVRGRQMGATFGFQKVFIEDGETTFGINVLLQM